MAQDYSVGMSLTVRPDPSSLRDARDEIEDSLGSVTVDVDGTRGNGTRSAGASMLSDQADNQEALIRLADERNELLQELVSEISAAGSGGGSSGGGRIPRPRGGGGGGFGGIGGLIGLLGLAGGAAFGSGGSGSGSSGTSGGPPAPIPEDALRSPIPNDNPGAIPPSESPTGTVRPFGIPQDAIGGAVAGGITAYGLGSAAAGVRGGTSGPGSGTGGGSRALQFANVRGPTTEQVTPNDGGERPPINVSVNPSITVNGQADIEGQLRAAFADIEDRLLESVLNTVSGEFNTAPSSAAAASTRASKRFAPD